MSGDEELAQLLAELRGYPSAPPLDHAPLLLTPDEGSGVFVPLQLLTSDGVLSLISTTTVFGTPVDVTLSEIALECFFPADEETAARLHRAAAMGQPARG